MRLTIFATTIFLLWLPGCDAGDDNNGVGGDPVEEPGSPTEDGPDPVDDAPFEELYSQGIDRYLGVFTPTQANSLEGGVTSYTFDPSDNGPLCYTGNPFEMSTRDGSGSELMIFLQGGGVCGPDSCDATDATSGIPPLGILRLATPNNPTEGYNVGYLPYCDGTFFTGDQDVDSDEDGSADRFFRGLQNLSASLDVIAAAYPEPSKILLIGNSAGGAATNFALPLVRKLYPYVEIELVNDSGFGLRTPGTQESLNEYWNSGAFFPASCPTCIGEDGNLTDYYKYQLSDDSNFRMAFIGSKQDEVIVPSFPEGGGAYEEELLAELAELNAEFPERFGSLIADGEEHTFVLKQFNFAIAGTTVKRWVTDMLAGSDNWITLSD